MHDGAPVALQAGGFGLQAAESELLRIHQQAVAKEHCSASGFGACSHAVQAFKTCGCSDRQLGRPAQDSLGQGML